MSGLPICHLSRSLNWRCRGMSAGLPSGAPRSTQLEMVAISASVRDGSSLNLVIPTLRSMCQGGISRRTTFSLIERAQGRASLYVRSAIGAIDPARWQFWQERSRMGAMSLEKVASATGLVVSAANADTRNRLEIEISCLLTATSFERLQFGLGTVRQRITVEVQNHRDELVIAH